MSEQFVKGGQQASFHDQGDWSGFFHTYDALSSQDPSHSPRKIHVFIPRDYEVSQARYPVLYLNDGDKVFFPGGAYHKTWKLSATLNRLYLRNAMRKIMVVAVCPLNRDYEYTHAPMRDRDWGGLDQYAQYLAQNLKPFIDQNYRTLANAENSVIGGSSHGGLAAFYTATQYPDTFGCVAALSPSFWVGLDSLPFPIPFKDDPGFHRSLRGSVLIQNATETLRQQRLKIYLDWGLIREGGEHNEWIEARATDRSRELTNILVQEFGYRHHENLFVVEDPIGQHSEESWGGRMENILQLFFGYSS